MTRPANQPAEQIQQAAPRPASDPAAPAQESNLLARIPLAWRIVFVVWAVCFALLLLNEAASLIGKLFSR